MEIAASSLNLRANAPKGSKAISYQQPRVAVGERDRNRTRWLTGVAALVLAATPPTVFSADWSAASAVGGHFDSNRSRGERASDREEEYFIEPSMAATAAWTVDRDLIFEAGIGVDGGVATRFEDLSFLTVAAPVSAQWKFGLGNQAPKLKATFTPSYTTTGEEGASGWRAAPAIGISKRFGERFEVEAGARYEEDARTSELFDGSGSHLFAGMAFDLTTRAQFRMDYSFHHGDIVSYATPPRPDLVAIAELRAPRDTFDREQIAYRIEADTHSIGATWSQALTDSVSLNLGYRFEHTNEQDLNYPRHHVALTLLTSF